MRQNVALGCAATTTSPVLIFQQASACTASTVALVIYSIQVPGGASTNKAASICATLEYMAINSSQLLTILKLYMPDAGVEIVCVKSRCRPFE